MDTLHAIVPAGGAGTRLWPLSRRDHPKFLLDLLGGGHTLIQETVLRLLPVADSVMVVTGSAHAKQVKHQLDELEQQSLIPEGFPIRVVAEPSGRDSMPAIGLATYLLREIYGDHAVVGSFAADHVIREPEEFHLAVRTAIAAAEEGYISTIGLQPTEPSTGFGYIERSGLEVTDGAWKVSSFVEKPDKKTAARYVESGYLWNAGMFVMQAGALVSILNELRPSVASTLEEIASRWETPKFRKKHLMPLWDQLPSIAIDHAVAEPAALLGKVAVAPMSSCAGWSDLGDFVAIHENAPEAGGASEKPSHLDDPLLIDADGAIVRAPGGKKVVVLGISNAVVIDTPDALLVTTRELAQEVKQVPSALESAGRADLI